MATPENKRKRVEDGVEDGVGKTVGIHVLDVTHEGVDESFLVIPVTESLEPQTGVPALVKGMWEDVKELWRHSSRDADFPSFIDIVVDQELGETMTSTAEVETLEPDRVPGSLQAEWGAEGGWSSLLTFKEHILHELERMMSAGVDTDQEQAFSCQQIDHVVKMKSIQLY